MSVNFPLNPPFERSALTAPRPQGHQLARDLAGEMFERHHDELYRAAYRACRDPETADDLVQEALLRLIVEIDTKGAPENMRAWLHRVVANMAVSIGRHESVGRKYAGALVRHEEPATPEAIVLDNESRSDLASALRTLPEGARTALVLAASGYAGAEIATAIGRSDVATRTMMSRARVKLRDRVAA